MENKQTGKQNTILDQDRYVKIQDLGLKYQSKYQNLPEGLFMVSIWSHHLLV